MRRSHGKCHREKHLQHRRGTKVAPIIPGTMFEAYSTPRGRMLVGKIEDALEAPALRGLEGKVNLIFTSPPFPLNRKKRYGNLNGPEYLKWLAGLAPRLRKLLAPDGSIVVEIGNAWESGKPVMSTLPLRALLKFQEAGKLHLCQHVICHNPARLPTPAQWVTIKRCRLKDSYTHVWWMSASDEPKADNRRVLTPYQHDMLNLLRTKKYNAGRRPSGHVISDTGFLQDHGGAIAGSVLEIDADPSRIPHDLLRFSNTKWDANYVGYCREHGLDPHPARMRLELAAFFISFLTEQGDLVLDPFAGSNTTGAAADKLGRKWLSVEADPGYAEGSKGRFGDSLQTSSRHDAVEERARRR